MVLGMAKGANMNETDSLAIQRILVEQYNTGKLDTLVALRLIDAVRAVTVKTDKN